jgi:hypothetical protein
LYVALGDREKAFELLEKSYAARDFVLTSLKAEPGYDPIHEDARFRFHLTIIRSAAATGPIKNVSPVLSK